MLKARIEALIEALIVAAWASRPGRLLCRLRNHPQASVMVQDHELFRLCPHCGRLPGIIVEGQVLAVRHLPGDPMGPRVAVGQVARVDTDQLSPAGQRRLLLAVCDQPDLFPEPRGPIFTELDRIQLFFNHLGK